MTYSLALTAFMMGVLGGPHCVVMCGAACAGIGQASKGRIHEAMLTFLLGRLLGYSLLGFLAALSMQSLAWLTVQTAAARPVWTMLHIAAGLLGLVLLWVGRQPPWLEQGARRVWARVQQYVQRGGRQAPAVLGMAWALMPCGLLYSAVMVAGLSDSVGAGAAVMALFAVGSSVSLWAGPWLLLKLARFKQRELGVRLAGLALVLMAGSALWMGLVHQQAPWCVTPG
jgi:sulfite exporter TauE/SafE